MDAKLDELLPVSREWQIDCRVREIIGKMVEDTASPDEIEEMHRLTKERADRMMPTHTSPQA